MTLGYPQGKAQIDSKAGALALTLRNTFRDVATFKAFLDAKTDAELTALTYSTTEVATLRAAFTDLDNLRKVASAQSTQASANDFFFNAVKLYGVE